MSGPVDDGHAEPPEVPGEWVVDHEVCMACGAPPTEAPELMGFGRNHADPRWVQCYFKKQPSTPKEVERACRAASASCCRAVRYTGRDERIHGRISALARGDGPRPAYVALILAGLVALFWLSVWAATRTPW